MIFVHRGVCRPISIALCTLLRPILAHRRRIDVENGVLVHNFDCVYLGAGGLLISIVLFSAAIFRLLVSVGCYFSLVLSPLVFLIRLRFYFVIIIIIYETYETLYFFFANVIETLFQY